MAFLPETLGATLPETLEEASSFAVGDKFFSFLPKREDDSKLGKILDLENSRSSNFIGISVTRCCSKKVAQSCLNSIYSSIYVN